MNSLVVLMYHGLYRDERELDTIDASERPYAISLERFERQLDSLAQAGIPVLDPGLLTTGAVLPGGVVLTFDDGHESNFRHALPTLADRGIRGAFFVTSDFIGKRRGYCDWMQVREMADGGMLIGSHGRTHRFFDDMTADEAESELRTSKEAIEQAIARPVQQISFPGGRYRGDQIAIGRRVGYRLFHSSRIGATRLQRVSAGAVLSRIPIRRTTTDEAFDAYVRADSMTLLRARFLAGAKQGVRYLIGNRLYHRLYERVAGRG